MIWANLLRMNSQKLVKKGLATRDKEGALLLINEEYQAYRVDESVVAIWDMCEGKTVEELTVDIAASTGREASDLKKPIESLVSKLKEAKLLE